MENKVNEINKDGTLKFSLKEFDGPIDLLLTLITKKKMDIKNLDVASIANQYYEYVSNADKDIDVDDLSEYMVMAAQLLNLKTKSLLPINAGEDGTGDKDFERERERLIKKILEYKMYKETLAALEVLKENREKMFSKDPEDYEDYFLDEVPMGKLPKKINPEKLFNLFDALILKRNLKTMKLNTIEVPEVSISVVQKDLVDYLEKNNNRINLFEYFDNLTINESVIEYYCTLFLAMLVLLKREWIILESNVDDVNNEVFIVSLNKTKDFTNFEDILLENE